MRHEGQTSEPGENYLEEKHAEGGLPLTGEEKGAVMHLPGTQKGINRRRLRGDRNQCSVCNQYFNSTKAFDEHRIGSFRGGRRCLSVSEMQARNFGETQDGFWLCAISTQDRERLTRLRTGQQQGEIMFDIRFEPVLVSVSAKKRDG